MKVAWLFVFVIACGDDAHDPGVFADAAARDAVVPDGATVDGATIDGVAIDGATIDGATIDGATIDGATIDAAVFDAGDPDAGVGELVVSWQTARGATTTDCADAYVASVDVRVLRVGDTAALAYRVPCDDGRVTIDGLEPGDYEIEATPLDAEDASRAAPQTATETLGAGASVESAFLFAFPEGGQILLTWSMIKAGEDVSCAEAGADTATVSLFDGMDGILPIVPCDDHALLTVHVPLGSHTGVLALQDWSSSTGYSRLFLPFDATLSVHEEIVVVPLVFEYFDEPEHQLLEIAASAKALYDASADPKTFPPSSASFYPGFGVCCMDTPYFCSPDPDLWLDEPWPTLGFSEPSPHRFQYRFESSGSGTSATFTVTARGDIDCDFEVREYRVEASVDGSGNVVGWDTIIPIKTLD